MCPDQTSAIYFLSRLKRSFGNVVFSDENMFRFRPEGQIGVLRKHPFWGCQELVDGLHKETMDALQARPCGAVIKVSVCFLGSFRSHNPFQVPYKPGRTAVNRMFTNMGLVSRQVVFKPMLTKAHRRRRFQFAKAFKSWTVEKWSKVVFSDEKIFRVIPGGHVRRWIPKNVRKFDARYAFCSMTSVTQLPTTGTVYLQCPDHKESWCGLQSTGGASSYSSAARPK